MIRFTCPGCQSKLSAKDKLAGQSRKCPKCGTEVRIPQGKDRPEPAPEPPPESARPAVKATAVKQPLPRFEGPKHLTRGNRYLICDPTRVFATWSEDSGWMLKTNAGLLSAARNPDLLPAEGNFTLVELRMRRTQQGLFLAGVHCYKLATRWAMLALEQEDDKILTKLHGPGSLNREQKTAVFRFLKEHFMPEVWENAKNARDFLTNADYLSAGTE